ncbi:MAG: TonB-dependent receptor plug domain-containing protein, partial [Brevundimonas sp.]
MPREAPIPSFRAFPACLRLNRALLQVALLACLAGTAGAQDLATATADTRVVDATTLDTIQVTAPIVKNTGTATKTDTPLIEIPQSISVITDRQMRDRGIHGIEEALWYTAGTQGGQYGDDSRSDWTLIRGFKPARYLDGLAVVDGAWTGDSRIEPYG